MPLLRQTRPTLPRQGRRTLLRSRIHVYRDPCAQIEYSRQVERSCLAGSSLSELLSQRLEMDCVLIVPRMITSVYGTPTSKCSQDIEALWTLLGAGSGGAGKKMQTSISRFFQSKGTPAPTGARTGSSSSSSSASSRPPAGDKKQPRGNGTHDDLDDVNDCSMQVEGAPYRTDRQPCRGCSMQRKPQRQGKRTKRRMRWRWSSVAVLMTVGRWGMGLSALAVSQAAVIDSRALPCRWTAGAESVEEEKATPSKRGS